MNVLIVKDSLSASAGTTKFAISLARGFTQLGHSTKLIFLHESPTGRLIEPSLAGLNWTIVSSGATYAVSSAMQYPFTGLFFRSAFSSDDHVDFLRGIASRQLAKTVERSDLVIAANIWSATCLLLHHENPRVRRVVYFHEPPRFDGLPAAFVFGMRTYLKELIRAGVRFVCLTDPLMSELSDWLKRSSFVMTNGYSLGPVFRAKEDFVLVDSRWTEQRNPTFILKIASRLRGTRFVVAGRFATDQLRQRFMNEREDQGLTSSVAMVENLTEYSLLRLYSHALCYVRWGILRGELGNPTGIGQAISSGCIPIVSRDLAIAPVLSDGISDDVVVDSEPGAFAQRILELQSNPELRARLVEAVVRYRDSHSWKNYCQELLSNLGLATAGS